MSIVSEQPPDVCYKRDVLKNISKFTGAEALDRSWAQISATTVGYWQKKRPKAAKKKRNLDQKVTDSKSHIWSLSFNFRFSSKKSQS